MEVSHNYIIRALVRAPRFFRFSFVGALGFCIDTGILYALMYTLGLSMYGARAISYFVSATCTWYLNRALTFADQRSEHKSGEWLRFLLCNLAAGAVNYLAYAAYVRNVTATPLTPLIGVAIGSIAGLGVNYTLAKHLVFLGRQPESPR